MLNRRIKILCGVALTAVLAALCSCASIPEQTDLQSEPGKGQFVLYLNGPDKTFQDLTFEIKGISIESEGGGSFPVRSAPAVINSRAIAGRQMMLGQINLPGGKYARLRITLGSAKIRTGNVTADLSKPREQIDVPIDLRVKPEEASSIFLVWEPDSSIRNKIMFIPSLEPRIGSMGLPALTFFVSNEGSGNISVINRNTNKVVDVLAAGIRPKGLATSLRQGQFKLYVANYGSNSVSFIDPVARKLDREVLIKYGQGPYDLAIAETRDEREVLFTANCDSNNVSVIDVMSGRETDKVDVGNGPVAIVADPPVSQFDNSRFISSGDLNTLRQYRQAFFNVYVADSRSQDISVIKVDAATGGVEGVTKIPVETTPVAISVDAQRANIYVVGHDSQYISVLNMVDLIKGDTTAGRIGNFGLSNSGVLADPSLNRLYVVKDFPGELMTINTLGGLSGGTTFGSFPVWGVTPLQGLPRSPLLDQEGREIYVVNRGSGSVSVISRTTGKEEKIIPVGGKPFEIVGFAQQ